MFQNFKLKIKNFSTIIYIVHVMFQLQDFNTKLATEKDLRTQAERKLEENMVRKLSLIVNQPLWAFYTLLVSMNEHFPNRINI